MVSDLLPHLAGVLIERVEQIRDAAWPRHVLALVRRYACPRCDQGSSRVPIRYGRRRAGRSTSVIRLRVRRFACHNRDCQGNTFAGQVEGLTTAYGQRAVPLAEMFTSIV